MDELFPRKGNFKVVRLCEADARGFTDHLRDFRELVLENEQMYPNIEEWFDHKVIPGMKSCQRVGYIGYLDEKPAVSAVMKRGKFTKFCHLRVREDLRDIHIGEAFFALMGLESRGLAKEIHFTLPESVWRMESKFFKSFGFTKAVKAGHQYRLFEDELKCSSAFEKVWSAILVKLPKIARIFFMEGYSLDNRILMSIKAEYAKRVLAGEKKVEIRRRFSKKWIGHKVSLYASRPESSIVGEALIKKVVVGEPESIWERFHKDIGCTREEFNNYTNSISKVYAIVLEETVPYRKTVSLEEMSTLTQKKLRAPQSYYNLNNNNTWAEAVSMGTLLQNNFRTQDLVVL